MTLAAWQTALAELLSTHASPRAHPTVPALSPTALTGAEQAWLDSLRTAPGFAVTCDVQRWWRHFRVQSAAPLTLSALGPDLRRQVVDEFVETCARPSSFFVREALRFLDFLLARPPAIPHLAQVVAFERAMLVLSESVAVAAPPAPAATLPSTIKRHPRAELVTFRAPPEHVIGALVSAEPLPSESDEQHWLLVAPNLPNLARRASPMEAWFFHSASTSEPMPTLHHDAIRSLWQAGALIAA